MRPMVTVYAPDRDPRQVINVRLSVQLGDAAATFGYPSVTAPAPRTRDIIREVAERHGLSPAELTGPSRCRHIVRPRQEAMWLCRQVTMEDGRPRFSFPHIGKVFGNRDHTTVLHGYHRHQERLDLAEASRRAWVAVV